MPSFRLSEIAERFGLQLRGAGETLIDGVATVQNGRPGAIGFLANRQYRKYLADTRLSAVIIGPQDADATAVPALIAADPYLTYAHVAALFAPADPAATGRIHARAVVDPGARLGDGVSIGANAVIGADVSIGAGTVIGPGSVIEAGCTLGEHCLIGANVTLCYDTCLGARCRVLPGAVIGGRGFGLAPSPTGWVEIPQLGRVLIGDDCEIGANTTIDRGALDDTVIEDGVKLDNQIQIAHNVRLGAHTVVAGCTAFAGSTEVGARSMIGGAVRVTGHLTIPPGTRINAGSFVTRNLPHAGPWSSGVPVQEADAWNRNLARLRQLADFVTEMRASQTKNDSDD